MSPRHPFLLAIVSLLVAGLAALWFLARPARDDESAGAPPAVARGSETDRPPAIEASPSPAPAAALAEGDRTPLAGAPPQPEDALGAIARTFRSDQPDLPGFENLLEQLAQQAILDPRSIVSDEDFLRATVTFPGSALVGEVSRSDGKCRVLLHTPFTGSNRALHVSHLQLSTFFDYQDGRATNIQSQMCFQPAAPSRSEGDAGWERLARDLSLSGSRLGYELRYEPGGVAVTPWAAELIDDPENGRAVSCGGVRNAAFRWASTNLGAYAAWGALLEKAAREHPTTTRRK